MKRLLAASAMAAILAGGTGISATLVDEETFPGAKISADILSFGPGARAQGMGEAYTAIADDASGAGWNPAGIAQKDTWAVSASHQMIMDGVTQSDFGALIPAGPVVLSLGAAMFDSGKYEDRDSSSKVTGKRDTGDLVLDGAIGLQNPSFLGGKGWSGFGVKHADGNNAAGIMVFDFGTIYPVGESTRIGAVLLNFGPGRYGFSTPAVAGIGVATNPLDALLVSVDAGYEIAYKQARFGGGVEYTVGGHLPLRIGYRRSLADGTIDVINGLSLGVGAYVSSLAFDYAYSPGEEMGASQRLSLSWGRVPAAK